MNKMEILGMTLNEWLLSLPDGATIKLYRLGKNKICLLCLETNQMYMGIDSE